MRADPQRQAVYDMEAREFRAAWFSVTQPMKYLRSLTRQVCKMYDAPNVTLFVRNIRGEGAHYDPVEQRICFGANGNNRNVFTLAHELAHHIVWHRHGDRAQDHGPTFVLVYGQLLSTLRLVPLPGWRAACRRHGVKIARCKSC